MKRLTYFLIFALIFAFPFLAPGKIIEVPEVAARMTVMHLGGDEEEEEGCSYQDSLVVGDMTDPGLGINCDDWMATKFQASATTTCARKIKLGEDSGGDACAGATVGWAVYGHDAGNDKPDGANIIASGTTTISWTGNTTTHEIDAGEGNEFSLTSGTMYWIAIIQQDEDECTNDPKLQFNSTPNGNTSLRNSYLNASFNDSHSPPGDGDWDSGWNFDEREVAIAVYE